MKAVVYLVVGIVLVIVVSGLIYSSGVKKTYFKIDENLKRYPVYDYRHGYTYRTADDYKLTEVTEERGFGGLDYTPYVQTHSKDCYNSPPKDKLIYIKCRNK
ncbi:MAG: hypothetical protein Q8N88_02520 [Nanoarchaeota archaeon]|nr:hypothetical protein [Nanoarchaeota archaeon]